ncbi:MAG TPA: terminase family protein [Caulobacteraceae bacterium]|nr:terminase family protein [Caulobacteraceae bacterium]
MTARQADAAGDPVRNTIGEGRGAGASRQGAQRWVPQWGPQTAFVCSKVFEVCYGGARGGGKTDAALGDFARHARLFGPGARGLMVRRTRVALNPTIERARRIFRAEGARWVGERNSFLWPSGAILYCRYLDNDADADAYQGHEYTRVYIEEMTQFPSPSPIDKLKATLRSPAGVPCGLRATCNPGGAGHSWVKARYIDSGPWVVTPETFINPFDGSKLQLDRIFIPARLEDNPALEKRDPQYVARLQQCGSQTLVKAWLEGDWNVTEGAFFDAWSSRKNILEPFDIPAPWKRFRSFDWGFATPFSVGWWAVVQEDHRLREDLVIPKGAMIRYREWYGKGARHNEGLRLNAEEVAIGILERERREGHEQIDYGVADPSIFRHESGPSIAERMGRVGVRFGPADNTRVGKEGALSGWDAMRARIAGDGVTPMLFVFSTCRDFIRTVPVMQHDPNRPEDMDTDGEDHIADETRYACVSRPRTAVLIDPVARSRQAHRLWRIQWGGDTGRYHWPNEWKTL